MKILLVLLAIQPFILSFSGCKKKDECNAGSGGNLTLIFKPQHHGTPINSSANYRDTVYLKYNAIDFPGTQPSNYNVVAAGNAGDDFVAVSGLKCGQYYVFMTGFDTSAVWNIRVAGGIPLDFSETSGSKTVVVPVSEQ